MESRAMFLLIASSSLLWISVVCKQCTNTLTHEQSFRGFHNPNNEQPLKREIHSQSHYHLTPSEDSTWLNLLPRKNLKEENDQNWAMVYRKIKNSFLFSPVNGLLKEISLHDVRLETGSMHSRAQNTNLEYLLMLDVDRLVWSFRKNAGLLTPAEPYGGWEGPEVELRGHFVGHYMSATAMMWASTHNNMLKKKMDAVVSSLFECQKKIGTGYLSAFPSDFFDRLEDLKPVWAPYYTIHKIMAGLIDQYAIAGNQEALKMVTWMADYFYGRVKNVISRYSIERHWDTLNEEFGGMNDVLYKLYSITGDEKHLILAHLFDKPCFLGMLALKIDELSGFHANSHIPIVIGSQRRYEITGEPLYKEIGVFFLDIVNSSHSYATGGTSSGEFWTNPKHLAETLGTEDEETCTTYNMLKVSRNLFRWTKGMAYADYYERALTNGILSIQRGTEPGVTLYQLPLAPGSSKAISYHQWGTKFESFWCCYGTAVESFSKLGDSIYFEEQGPVPALYIIQYISSTIKWRGGSMVITQHVDPCVSWNARLLVTFTFSSIEVKDTKEATINFRVPGWATSPGAKASLNGQDLPVPSPGSSFQLTRKWIPEDKLLLEFPISLRTEAIQDDRPQYASLRAILYGPYLLAGLTDGDWDINAVSATSYSDWINPIPQEFNSQLISLTQRRANSNLCLTNSAGELTMGVLPEPENDTSLAATFRLILKDLTQSNLTLPNSPIGRKLQLEPFNLPGFTVIHRGEGNQLVIAKPDASSEKGTIFELINSIDGQKGRVSLEADDQKGCYFTTESVNNTSTIRLKCISEMGDEESKKAASFDLGKGFTEYHPISFMARGKNRNFILVPLLSLSDQSYTVYFNIIS